MGVCTDNILKWLNQPETKEHIKAAGSKFSRSDIDKIIEVENAFSENFESIHHTQVDMTDHFNKLKM